MFVLSSKGKVRMEMSKPEGILRGQFQDEGIVVG
jgi:hypothetical protein